MKVKTTFILLLVQFLYGNGNPYFQQMVKYEIDVTLNDSAHTLSAYERLEYTNNSPDTLEYIWFHLWPNAYKNDSTAFTVSIEAKEGVTTGISAADRAHTISVAINNKTKKEDLVFPGHVFPVMAWEGGVLRRAGHTEAAVDISTIAGLNPSGVICEIMSEDGTMARLPELINFSKQHSLKIGSVEDLIKYRLKSDNDMMMYN